MTSSVIKRIKSILREGTTADGILYNDWDAVIPCQIKCVETLAHSIQLEEEAYLINHPEIMAMLKLLTCKAIRQNGRKNLLELAGRYFTSPFEKLDNKIRKILKSPPEGPYANAQHRTYRFVDDNLKSDLMNTILEFYPLATDLPSTTETETSNTTSSSFISLISSSTTQPTPEPTPVPEPTLSDIIFKMVVNCMDKATASKLTDDLIKYDTAYVEVMKIVEVAMEIPVIGVREDIANLLGSAFATFDNILEERAKIAADIAWDRRMRKKLKRSIRRQENFRGYKTPSTPSSGLPSSHESYRIPPQRPCKCHPQWTYNRYPKDRFGIYLPRDEVYEFTSITVSPGVSTTQLIEPENNQGGNIN
ncbi:unnamed protein product [Arctia plantaginis]|uniref:Uncharacterized protein n=1 Tax=Arctia plantaginis TaxID=874455 RepID=A0A8S0YZE9_ARCPL|nr:unnamed protein product [Arctia plantaginis]